MFNRKIVDIPLLVKNIIVELVNLYQPSKTSVGRPSVCSTEEYVDLMFYVLKEGIGWEYLNFGKVKGNTVQKKFKHWLQNDIFKKTWVILVHIYDNLKMDFNDLFIDASHIKNILGYEKVGKNFYDRYRLATKLSIITDDIGAPIGIHIDKSNVHDLNLTENTIEKIPVDIESTKYLIGDKGYIGSDLEKKIYEKYKIQLNTPKRRNSRRNSTEDKKYGLSKRYIVEHTFSWFKNFKRLRNRYDKKIAQFQNFVYFGASCIVSKKIDKFLI